MSTYSVTDARAALPVIVQKVQAGEEVELTRHGQVVAVLVSPSTLRARRAGDAFEHARRLREFLDDCATAELPPAGLAAERGEELVAAIRRDRDASGP